MWVPPESTQLAKIVEEEREQDDDEEYADGTGSRGQNEDEEVLQPHAQRYRDAILALPPDIYEYVNHERLNDPAQVADMASNSIEQVVTSSGQLETWPSQRN